MLDEDIEEVLFELGSDALASVDGDVGTEDVDAADKDDDVADDDDSGDNVDVDVHRFSLESGSVTSCLFFLNLVFQYSRDLLMASAFFLWV